MCLRTLKNQVKKLGLRRKSIEFDKQKVRECLNKRQRAKGHYRTMWHSLCQEGFMVPCQKVSNLSKEVNHESGQTRKAHHLNILYTYINPGPNYCWHFDGYEKLKPSMGVLY